jgi:hypothetical protein
LSALNPEPARISAWSKTIRCEIDIEGVGTLRNPIADEPA